MHRDTAICGAHIRASCEEADVSLFVGVEIRVITQSNTETVGPLLGDAELDGRREAGGDGEVFQAYLLAL